jgi:hypothetical protein
MSRDPGGSGIADRRVPRLTAPRSASESPATSDRPRSSRQVMGRNLSVLGLATHPLGNGHRLGPAEEPADEESQRRTTAGSYDRLHIDRARS